MSTEQDALWAACVDDPGDETARLVLADRLADAGFETLAVELRGPGGRLFVEAAACPPGGIPAARLLAMTHDEQQHALDRVLGPHLDRAFDSGPAAGAVADSRVSGWAVDEFEVLGLYPDANGCRVDLEFTATPDPNTGFAPPGAYMGGSAEVTVGRRGEITFEVTSAALGDREEEHREYEERLEAGEGYAEDEE